MVVEDTPKEPIPQDKISLLRYLEKTSPETLALARDWDDTALDLKRCRDRIDRFV
jgi:U3 small nucleolar RNA-associated protein 3